MSRLYILTLLISFICRNAYKNISYIMRNAGLDEAQAGVKIAGRNNNNLRYADDTTLKTESEDELKSLLMKVKEESGKKKKNPGLKLNILSRGSYHQQTVRVLLLLFQSVFLLFLFLL